MEYDDGGDDNVLSMAEKRKAGHRQTMDVCCAHRKLQGVLFVSPVNLAKSKIT